MRILSALICLFAWGQVWAIPVTWTLQGVAFDDGGVASGSFTYDADTNTYSDIALITTNGSTLNGAVYGYVNTYYPFIDADSIIFADSPSADLSDAQQLVLFFAEDLTSSGGSVGFRPTLSSVEVLCGNTQCSVSDGTERQIVAGYVTAVPIPAAAWLFGSALAGLGWLKRK